MDGQTATNPQTGEKVVLRNGQWVPMGQEPAPPQPRQVMDRIYGAPKQPDPIELQRLGMAQEDQARQNRMAPLQEESARLELESKRRALATTASGKPLPDGAAKRLEDTIGLYANLKSAVGGFQDDYAGNTITGGLENTIQGLNSGFGTPGQRDWWANFRTLDNQIRNELFGATLTPSEQAAYAQTSINERMDPKTIRENLTRRERMIRDALSRRAKFLKANGYNADAVDALLGEFSADLGEQPQGDRRNLAPDEQVVFNDEAKPVTGYRFSPDQEAQIFEAMRVGDEGQTLALMQRFSGNPPTAETIDSVRKSIDNLRKGGKVAINYGSVDRAAQDAADRERYGDNLPQAIQDRQNGSGLDALIRGAADTATFGLADELAAAGTTLFSGGTMRENLQRERAIDEADSRVNFPERTIGQFAGGVAVPLGAGVNTARGMAAYGGAGGALYGFGSGDSLSDRALGAAAGGVAGATGGYAVGRASNAVGNALAMRAARRTPQVSERNALMQAADRQGVDLMPADVGGPMVGRLTAGAAQAPLSATPIINAGRRTVEQSRTARDRIASQTGQVLDTETAGEVARAGGERFIARTRQQADRYYERAERAAQGAKITPTRTMEALDRNIADLEQIPGMQGGPQLAELKRLREQVAAGNLSIRGARGMRTALRNAYLGDDNLRGSDFQRRVGEIVDAAGEDVLSNLAEQGLDDAATAFRRADQFYRGRVEAIDNFLEPIIGKGRSGEQVMQAVENAAKSNGKRLQGFVRSLPDDERAAVQATIISRLGVKRGDAEASDFSLDVFLTQYKAMTPRAKATLFPGEARSALDDLARIAEGSKQAASYANRSNTSGGVMAQVLISGGAGFGGPVPLAIASVGQYGAGKLLASPSFARWLARAPKTQSPGALRAWANRIPNAITQNPTLRTEVQKFQQGLLANIQQSPSRVRAEDGEQDRRPEPIN